MLAVFVLLALYLWAALRPGVWLRDAFLYEQADGSFAGKDAYGRYALTIAPGSEETEVCFWRDGTPVNYRLKAEQTLGGASHVEIEREGRLLFAGSAQGEPGDAILWKQYGGLADDIQIVVNGAYSPEDLEPTGHGDVHRRSGGGKFLGPLKERGPQLQQLCQNAVLHDEPGRSERQRFAVEESIAALHAVLHEGKLRGGKLLAVQTFIGSEVQPFPQPQL